MLAVVGASLLGAAPAMADGLPEVGANVGSAEVDSNFLFGANSASNWNFSAAAVCFNQLAVVPAAGAWAGNTSNNCVNGNVINHSSR